MPNKALQYHCWETLYPALENAPIFIQKYDKQTLNVFYWFVLGRNQASARPRCPSWRNCIRWALQQLLVSEVASCLPRLPASAYVVTPPTSCGSDVKTETWRFLSINSVNQFLPAHPWKASAPFCFCVSLFATQGDFRLLGFRNKHVCVPSLCMMQRSWPDCLGEGSFCKCSQGLFEVPARR